MTEDQLKTLIEQIPFVETNDHVNEDGDGLPFATHTGVMEIMGKKLRCYRLNTGQIVFNAEDVRDFFGGEIF